MPSLPFLWPLSPTTTDTPLLNPPLSSPNPHAHLLSGLRYPRVQEQLHPALVKSLGCLHGYENVPKCKAFLSPVSHRRTDLQVLLLPATISLWAHFAPLLWLLRNPFPEPWVPSRVLSPTVPHGEESHADKENCGSRETMDEPTAHGSQIVPAAASILLNKDNLCMYLRVKLSALLEASERAEPAESKV